MGLADRLRARARGDVPVAELAVYARGGADAYELLDQVPPAGTARLCAWNAFVLQSYGDALAASGATPGFVAAETAELARSLYELVEQWLERAREAAADPDYRLDAFVPQPLPHRGSASHEQLEGMRRTLDAARARIAPDVEAAAEPRLRTLLVPVDSGAEYAERLWTASPGPELRETLATTLRDALDRVYELGQLAACPELLEEVKERPAPQRPAERRIALPGEPGFNPWCLTDPLQRARLQLDQAFQDAVEQLWRDDPHPERTLAIHAEVEEALARGAVDYMPSGEVGAFAHLADRCPWPGILYARAPVLVGGQEIEPGERFVLVVGRSEDGGFERAIVAAPTGPLPDLHDVPPESTGALVSLYLGSPGFRVLSI